mmetsp:Transcript_66027/g.162542  ORF Transcript_66027/g.162542 Transcript_66027/m.162542 type:complete len:426 (+) Transcript_66027:1088-2365(+)
MAFAGIFVSEAARLGLPVPALEMGMEDVKSAYPRTPVRTTRFNIIAMMGESGEEVVFRESFGLSLGNRSSVPVYTRRAALLNEAARFFLAVPSHPYVDDYPVIDLALSCGSAQWALSKVFSEVLGAMPFSSDKSVSPAAVCVALGVGYDFSDTHRSLAQADLFPVHAKLEDNLSTLRYAKLTNVFHPGLASKVLGQLSQLSTVLFGRVGFSALRPLRTHNSDTWNDDLSSMLDLLEAIFAAAVLSRCTFRLGVELIDRVVIYSDAQNTPPGLGFVFSDRHVKLYGSRPPPKGYLQSLGCNPREINCLELVAAVALLFSLPSHLIRNRRIIFCVDNSATLAALVTGSSSLPHMALLARAFQIKMAMLRLSCWFEVVSSECNLADLPSRSGGYCAALEVEGDRMIDLRVPPLDLLDHPDSIVREALC